MADKRKGSGGKTDTTGGGEFSEGGGPGRTSETQGNRDAMSGSSSSGSGSKSSGTGFETSRSAGGSSGGGESSGTGGESSSKSETRGSGSGKSGRYSIDCAEAGEGCSLRISGTYDEVLAAGVEHGRSAHGMSGDDKKLRDDIKGYVKEEEESGVPMSGMPGSRQGRGQSQSGSSPRPS